VPRTALTDVPASKLPVLLFIHGGAFLGGSQSIQVSGRELFDATNLVRKSILRRQALIVVTINYRVGPLGFLASHELREFKKRHNEPVGTTAFTINARRWNGSSDLLRALAATMIM
jgi:carboxylesterase type B